MLWKDFSLEIEEHCIRSADHVRKELGKQLDNPEIGPEMTRHVQLLQQLFQVFMDEVGPSGDNIYGHHRSMGTDPLSMALGRLRGLVGIRFGELAAEYGLNVSEELVGIVPDQAGWFFEKFEARSD